MLRLITQNTTQPHTTQTQDPFTGRRAELQHPWNNTRHGRCWSEQCHKHPTQEVDVQDVKPSEMCFTTLDNNNIHIHYVSACLK